MPPRAPEKTPRKTPCVLIRLLATSDVHMQLFHHDYHADQASQTKGLTLTSSLIRQARQEVNNSLLFDNGDFLEGSLLGYYALQKKQAPHPAIQAMNTLGYDAINLGNHEFSYGLDFLKDALRAANFPILCANLLAQDPHDTVAAPSILLERVFTDTDGTPHSIKIGVVGVLPPQTMLWENTALHGRFTAQEMHSCVAEHAVKLRADGADVVIALLHCGIGTQDTKSSAENIALDISTIPTLDALILGHTHQIFPGKKIAPTPGVSPQKGTLNQKPAVMPGVYGSHLGIIDLTLHKSAAAGWHVKKHKATIRSVFQRNRKGEARAVVRPDPALKKQLAPFHHSALKWIREPLTRIHSPLHSYFAMIHECDIIRLINAAQLHYAREKLQDSPWRDFPILSAAAPFKMGGRAGPENYCFVPKGKFLRRNAADIYPYHNTLVLLDIAGADLERWLNNAVRIFNCIPPGAQNIPLIDIESPSFQFDTIQGLKYEIDLSPNPSGHPRATNIRYNNAPIAPEQRFILATNNHRYIQNTALGLLHSAHNILYDHPENHTLLIDYISQERPIHRPDHPTWSFRPMPGTTVTFDSAPQSLSYCEHVSSPRVLPLEITAEGFQRYLAHL